MKTIDRPLPSLSLLLLAAFLMAGPRGVADTAICSHDLAKSDSEDTSPENIAKKIARSVSERIQDVAKLPEDDEEARRQENAMIDVRKSLEILLNDPSGKPIGQEAHSLSELRRRLAKLPGLDRLHLKMDFSTPPTDHAPRLRLDQILDPLAPEDLWRKTTKDLLDRNDRALEDALEKYRRSFELRPTIIDPRKRGDRISRRRVVQKPGFFVSRRQFRRALRRPGGENLSLEVRIARTRASLLTESDALRASERIRAALVEAGRLVKREQLAAAVTLLNDPALLAGSAFHFSPHRSPIWISAAESRDERTFLTTARHMLRFKPSVGPTNGVITIPLEPPAFGSGRELTMARALWIRETAEELAHAAQMLRTHADPGDRFVSEMMSSERSVVRSLVALEVERLNEKAPRWFGLKKPTFYNYEADVYAFLIETFGPDFIPSWFGIESGYEIRRLIDEELTARGVPNREWPPL